MNVRPATEADREVLRELWEEFTAELDDPPYHRETWAEAWPAFERYIRDGIALIAEEDAVALGYALARIERRELGYLSDLFVRERARRRGIAKALLGEAVAGLAARGARWLTLNVNVGNAVARTVYSRLGFREESLDLAADLDALQERLAEPGGETFGSIHVQTDDVDAVERAVAQFVPRLGQSGGTSVAPPRNGWVAVYDELCDREPAALRRLARELSERMGSVVVSIGVEQSSVVRYALHDRGGVVDEYLSVPEYFGPLPPGDVIALGANPTVLARLTGADPARVRAVARTAAFPADLPPAPELLGQIAAVLGIEGAGHGYEPSTG